MGGYLLMCCANIYYSTAHMEIIYKHYEIASTEDPYRERIDTMSQNINYGL